MTHEAPKSSAVLTPQPKVAAAGVAGAAVTVVIFAFSMFGFEIPESAAAAIVTLVAFGAAYFKR